MSTAIVRQLPTYVMEGPIIEALASVAMSNRSSFEEVLTTLIRTTEDTGKPAFTTSIYAGAPTRLDLPPDIQDVLGSNPSRIIKRLFLSRCTPLTADFVGVVTPNGKRITPDHVGGYAVYHHPGPSNPYITRIRLNKEARVLESQRNLPMLSPIRWISLEEMANALGMPTTTLQELIPSLPANCQPLQGTPRWPDSDIPNILNALRRTPDRVRAPKFSSKAPLPKLLLQWLSTLDGTVASSTRSTYRSEMSQCVRVLGQNFDLPKSDYATIRRLCETVFLKEGISRITIKLRLATLRRWWGWSLT